MTFQRGSNAHRYISLAIMAVFALIFITLVGYSLQLKSGAQQEYEELIFQLKKYQNLVASLPEQRNQNQKLKRFITSRNLALLGGAEQSIVTAEIQQQLRQLAQTSGVRLTSIQANSSISTDELLVPLKIKLQLSATHQNLLVFIQLLESAQPYGFIDGLSIKALNQTRTAHDYLTKLNVAIDFRVYMEPLNVH